MSSKLCEALAKKESLRKKDYNTIMADTAMILFLGYEHNDQCLTKSALL